MCTAEVGLPTLARGLSSSVAILRPSVRADMLRWVTGSRIFDSGGRVVLRIPAPAFAGAVDLLTEAARGQALDVVVGIARGGMRPAAEIASRLGLPLVAIRARHNANEKAWNPPSGAVTVSPPSAPLPRLARALVVDDIWGSGETARSVVSSLEVDVRPYFVALCRNDGAAGWPDAWVWSVRDWVCFPWEESPPDCTMIELSAPLELLRP